MNRGLKEARKNRSLQGTARVGGGDGMLVIYLVADKNGVQLVKVGLTEINCTQKGYN
jgi:hypothetical protein